MWHALLATQEMFTVYLGVKLGLYDELATQPLTAPELARRAGIAVRYAREWLEQQAVAGILVVNDVGAPGDSRTFTLPAAHAEVLAPGDRPGLLSPHTVLPLGGVAAALPRLLDAYRSGDGVPDGAYGEDWRAGHGAANRALFGELPVWIEKHLPDVHAILTGSEARVADVACGAGWSAVTLAQAYPRLTVRGFDLDAPIVAEACRNAEAAGVADRVTFEVRDVADPAVAGGYDLVCLFDALHELPQPVTVLRACRALCAPSGTVMVMDARVANTFTAPADETERFQYCTSLLHCLPAALCGPGAAGTGTVLRPDAVRALAVEAGFAAVSLLPVDDRFHNLYRLIN